tara:strand:- start:1769 stop:2719 length:951 start_codon:yes stop_codon:yes gene_type:complete
VGKDLSASAVDAELRLSIVVPSYNQADFIAATLDSIFSQSVEPYEVIVVDGGSSDGTIDILRDYERFSALRWLSETDEGPADAVNKGLRLATGDLVGIQSSDDIYFKDAFSQVVRTFSSKPDVGFVLGDVAGIDSNGNIDYTRRFKGVGWSELFAVSMCIPQSSIFFKRSLIGKVGYWNPAYYGCDLDFWMRLLFHTQAIHLPAVLSGWRRYPGQRTSPEKYRRIWDDYWRMISESKELASAPSDVRRWARASRHLLVLRFSPDPTFKFHFRHLVQAFLLHPQFVRYNPRRALVKQLMLVPGGRALLLSIKKWLKR